MTTTEDVDATLQSVAKLHRTALEALAFDALINSEKYTAAVALADACLELKHLSETHGAGRKGGLPLKEATHVRDLALTAYREVTQ